MGIGGRWSERGGEREERILTLPPFQGERSDARSRCSRLYLDSSSGPSRTILHQQTSFFFVFSNFRCCAGL